MQMPAAGGAPFGHAGTQTPSTMSRTCPAWQVELLGAGGCHGGGSFSLTVDWRVIEHKLKTGTVIEQVGAGY